MHGSSSATRHEHSNDGRTSPKSNHNDNDNDNDPPQAPTVNDHPPAPRDRTVMHPRPRAAEALAAIAAVIARVRWDVLAPVAWERRGSTRKGGKQDKK